MRGARCFGFCLSLASLGSGSCMQICTMVPKSILDRFWRRVTKSDGCWFWQGYIRGKYGVLSIGGRGSKYAHRLSWEIHKGSIDHDKIVMHICDNPICVNPDHLKLGTYKENQQDMADKNRGRKSKLMPAQIEEIIMTEKIRGSGLLLAKKFNVTPQHICLLRQKKLKCCSINTTNGYFFD